MVPAGGPTEQTVKALGERMEKGDIIIDGGNSYFKDTDVRARNLAAKGIQFLGVGVSGGEEGARHGPSLMPGGPKEAYERVRPVFEAAAAKVNGETVRQSVKLEEYDIIGVGSAKLQFIRKFVYSK